VYKTVAGAAETEYVERKSRFIARCWPVETEAEAAELLAGLRKRYYDASHHCYAWRIGDAPRTGSRGEMAKSSDDGEPSGTAGRPILEVLTRQDVTNVLLVVTRYFGGILLGAGGLVRAYTKAATLALDAAGIAEMRDCARLEIRVPYALWDSFQAFLRGQGICEWDAEYTEDICCRFWILAENAGALAAALGERFFGSLTAEVLERELRVNS